jgi:monoamine oxidase
VAPLRPFRRPSNAGRRRALALLAGALAAAPLRAARGRRVVVVGAGMAGLAAARALADAGSEVRVLEARPTLGGRIRTSRAWPDMPMDLGASWIHGVDGNPLTALADAAGAPRILTSYDSGIALDAAGRELALDTALARAGRLLDAARAAAEDGAHDVSLAAAVAASPDWLVADARERRLLRHFVNSTIEQEYGGDWTETSARYFDEDAAFGGDDALFPQGYDRLVSHLAQGLDVRTGTAVRALAPARGGVRVTLADGGTLDADHAIVSVPLGVLRAGAIRFAAPLAAPRAAAIERLRMGLLNKCWLRFERVAWPADVDWIEWLGPDDGCWAQWLSLAKSARLPVLLAFHAGAQARELERLDDRATRAAAHAALKAMFGNRFPAPVAAQVTRWSREPHTLGAYSFNAVGASADTRRALGGSDWDGALVFAGEATSADYFGTVHGALLSGRAAARALGAGPGGAARPA